jgi:hypothetical protein
LESLYILPAITTEATEVVLIKRGRGRERGEREGGMGRKPCCSKDGLNRGTWTAMEDDILFSYVKKHGEGKWGSLPRRAGQCHPSLLFSHLHSGITVFMDQSSAGNWFIKLLLFGLVLLLLPVEILMELFQFQIFSSVFSCRLYVD